MATPRREQGSLRSRSLPESPEPDPPSAAEAARILNAAWADPDWGMLLWLTMITGRRRGEVSALRWRHIDFERGQLVIANNHVLVRGGVVEKETKSGSQPRVALDPHTLSLLAEHRGRAIERCQALGIELLDDAYVFSLSPDGSTFYLPSSISQRYRRLAKAQKLRSTRFHALRHYSATELIAAGVDVRTVAGRHCRDRAGRCRNRDPIRRAARHLGPARSPSQPTCAGPPRCGVGLLAAQR